MKRIHFLIFILLINIAALAQTKTNHLDFNGELFELPMTEKSAQKKFNLDKYDRNGDIDNRKYLAHKDSNDVVIGITSYIRCYKENLEKSVEVKIDSRENYITDLEKKHGSTFKLLNIGNVAFINPNFVYMELKNGLIIVIGTLHYNLMYNTYTTVSYFNGITVEQLPEYLWNLYS